MAREVGVDFGIGRLHFIFQTILRVLLGQHSRFLQNGLQANLRFLVEALLFGFTLGNVNTAKTLLQHVQLLFRNFLFGKLWVLGLGIVDDLIEPRLIARFFEVVFNFLVRDVWSFFTQLLEVSLGQ